MLVIECLIGVLFIDFILFYFLVLYLFLFYKRGNRFSGGDSFVSGYIVRRLWSGDLFLVRLFCVFGYEAFIDELSFGF